MFALWAAAIWQACLLFTSSATLLRGPQEQVPQQPFGFMRQMAVAAAPAPVAPAAPSAPPVVAAPAAAQPAAAAAVSGDCKGICDEAKKMWKDAQEARDVAIALEANRTAGRINAETDLLVEEVKMKVQSQGMSGVKLMQGQVDSYMHGRVQAFTGASASRQAQVVEQKKTQFKALKRHQGDLMEQLLMDMVAHSYDAAKSAVASEAMLVSSNFSNNAHVKGAQQEVNKAGDAWAKTYRISEESTKQSFGAWSGAYHALAGPWSNVSGSFSTANEAEKAARGLGPDTTWDAELVRISGDATQAAMTESKAAAAHTNLAQSMASRADALVRGNSGSIKTLTTMIDTAEAQSNQATMAAR